MTLIISPRHGDVVDVYVPPYIRHVHYTVVTLQQTTLYTSRQTSRR